MDNMEDKLFWAITNNDSQEVSLLLEAGVNVNYVGCFDETPLIYACRHSDINTDIVKNLLDYGAYVNHIECNGFSPLLLAVMRQNTKVVELLLDAGADLNLTLEGKNIIWYALQSSNNYMLDFVLSKTQIDIDLCDEKTKHTSFDWACFHGMEEYQHRLKQSGAGGRR